MKPQENNKEYIKRQPIIWNLLSKFCRIIRFELFAIKIKNTVIKNISQF